MRCGSADAVDRAAGYVVVLGLLAVTLLMFGWADCIPSWFLRLVGGLLATLGLVQCYLGLRRLPARWRELRASFGEADWWLRLSLGVLLVIALLLALAALGPPTDADSLDYHLGVPLEWLRSGGTIPRPDWPTSRLAAAGEALNLLGLANGTDCLGAVLQSSGLVVAAASLASLARDRAGRVLAWALVLASPILCVLATTQKPQLLPTAAVVTALVLFARSPRDLGGATAGLAFGCLGFAAACRYTFLIPGAVVGLFGLWSAHRARRLGPTLAWAVAAAALLVVPVLAWRLDLYGDPLSPFLEHWKANPDPAIVALARYLREYGGEISALRVLRLPLDLAVSFDPSSFQRVLGVGVLAFVAALRAGGVSRRLLVTAAAAAALTLLLAQLNPRFFAPAYLFAAAAAVAAPPTRRRTWLLRGLTLQALGVAGLAALAAGTLFPGALTTKLRDQTMRARSLGYAEARWLDRILPADARLLVLSRSRALMPRPFVVYEPTGDLAPGRDPKRIRRLIRRTAPTAAVIPQPAPPRLEEIFRCRGRLLAGPKRFPYAVRNPLAPTRSYRVAVLSLGPPRPGCADRPPGAPARAPDITR